MRALKNFNHAVVALVALNLLPVVALAQQASAPVAPIESANISHDLTLREARSTFWDFSIEVSGRAPNQTMTLGGVAFKGCIDAGKSSGFAIETIADTSSPNKLDNIVGYRIHDPGRVVSNCMVEARKAGLTRCGGRYANAGKDSLGNDRNEDWLACSSLARNTTKDLSRERGSRVGLVVNLISNGLDKPDYLEGVVHNDAEDLLAMEENARAIRKAAEDERRQKQLELLKAQVEGCRGEDLPKAVSALNQIVSSPKLAELVPADFKVDAGKKLLLAELQKLECRGRGRAAEGNVSGCVALKAKVEELETLADEVIAWGEKNPGYDKRIFELLADMGRRPINSDEEAENSAEDLNRADAIFAKVVDIDGKGNAQALTKLKLEESQLKWFGEARKELEIRKVEAQFALGWSELSRSDIRGQQKLLKKYSNYFNKNCRSRRPSGFGIHRISRRGSNGMSEKAQSKADAKRELCESLQEKVATIQNFWNIANAAERQNQMAHYQEVMMQRRQAMQQWQAQQVQAARDMQMMYQPLTGMDLYGGGSSMYTNGFSPNASVYNRGFGDSILSPSFGGSSSYGGGRSLLSGGI